MNVKSNVKELIFLFFVNDFVIYVLRGWYVFKWKAFKLDEYKWLTFCSVNTPM